MEHTAIDRQNQFLYFIGLNYIEAATLGVFRQLDRNRKSQSLLNLLRDVDNNAKLFTFRRFSARYPVSIRHTARGEFRKFSIKDGSRIDRRKIRKDIADLKRIAMSVVKYRHKVVAHRNRRLVSIRATVNDLYAAIDLLEGLVIKYNLLLTQGGMSTLRADNATPQLEDIFKS